MKDLGPGESSPLWCGIDHLGGRLWGTQRRGWRAAWQQQWRDGNESDVNCAHDKRPVLLSYYSACHRPDLCPLPGSENLPEPLAITLHIVHQNDTEVSLDMSSPSQVLLHFNVFRSSLLFLTLLLPYLFLAKPGDPPSSPSLSAATLFKKPSRRHWVTDWPSSAASKSFPAFLWHFFMSTTGVMLRV